MDVLRGHAGTRILVGLSLLVTATLPLSARADLYECKRAGGVVSYQETPCDGATEQTDHIQDRDPDSFVGCLVTTDSRHPHIFEVRPNGAHTFKLIDQRNPLGAGMVLKRATAEQLAAVSNGLRIAVSRGLSLYGELPAADVVYTAPGGRTFVQPSATTPQPADSTNLYGVYKGTSSEGRPVTLLYTGGRPQVVVGTTCPSL
jgi:hypothetical protein